MPELPLVVWIRSFGGIRLGGMPAGGIYLSLVYTYGWSIPPRGSIERTTYSWYLCPPE